MHGWVRLLAFLPLSLALSNAQADEALIACASNFKPTLDRLAQTFAQRTDHTLRISTGSTGTLYAKIVHGAPYDVFLAADERRPRLLIKKGLAVAGTRFTYAVGQLVLWSRDAGLIDGTAAVLREGGFRRLAMANPKTAPYGRAAQETLRGLGLWDGLRPKLVRGENIAQAFHYVQTGNAELGLVAASHLHGIDDGSRWTVPARYYRPLRQQAVLLPHGEGNPAARAFVRFLKTPRARSIITAHGYQDTRSHREPRPPLDHP